MNKILSIIIIQLIRYYILITTDINFSLIIFFIHIVEEDTVTFNVIKCFKLLFLS